jgi:hypothetical protein
LVARRKLLPGWDSITERFAPLFNQSLRPEAIIEQTHGPLFQQLNLTPDQRARTKELILKGVMAAVTKSMSLMNRKLDPERRAALIEELKTERQDCDAQIRQFLGEENYRALETHEKTIPDRTMISRFTSKSRGMAIPLNADQQAQLLRTLSEARAQYNWSTDFSQRNRAAANYAVMFSEESLNTFAREEEQFDRDFITQAERILSPQQLAAFQQFQTRQRQSRIMEMKAAAKLFAPQSR